MREWLTWMPAGVLALGCVFTLAVDHQQHTPLVRTLDSIPMTLGGREGQTASVRPEEVEAAGVSSYLRRIFPGATGQFEIYVGYYEHQTQGRSIHSPKNCLPGSGWEALQQRTTEVPGATAPWTVNRYLLQNKDQRALVFYWYQGRGRVAASEYRVKWELLRDAATRGRSEEALVRIVVFLDPLTNEEAAEDLARRVAADLIPAVFQSLAPG